MPVCQLVSAHKNSRIKPVYPAVLRVLCRRYGCISLRGEYSVHYCLRRTFAAYDHIDYSRVKGILDVEMSIPAIFLEDVQVAVKDRARVETCLRSGGNIMSRDAVLAAARKIVEG